MNPPRFDVTSFGECMLRLSVPIGTRLETARRLDVAPAGSEANVVGVLSQLGRCCSWQGRLPGNALGRLIASQLRSVDVDVDAVAWSKNGRLGTYFVELASPPLPIQVIYDRAGSCAAELRSKDIDWEALLDTSILHLTGITPALSESCAAVVAEARERAGAAGVRVSFDVNFREKLWSSAAAGEALLPLIRGVDLLLCSASDAQRLFGCEGEPNEIVEALRAKTQASQVVITLADRGAIASDGERLYHESARPVQIIDRIGAGDAMAAGVLHGCIDDDLGKGLHYGAILSALALGHHGDMLLTNAEELRMVSESTDTSVRR